MLSRLKDIPCLIHISFVCDGQIVVHSLRLWGIKIGLLYKNKKCFTNSITINTEWQVSHIRRKKDTLKDGLHSEFTVNFLFNKEKSNSHIISSSGNFCLDTVSRISDEIDEAATVDNSSEVNGLKQENRTLHPTKETFFLRHTARLPSSTSQLVLFQHLFCINLGGGGRVHFRVHFWGESQWRIQGAPPAHPHGSRFFRFDIQIFRNVAASGVGAPPMRLAPPMGNPGSATGSTSMFTSGGVPCDLSHNALIYCYRIPRCIMGKIHMGPPHSWTDWQKNTSENITFLHYVVGGNKTIFIQNDCNEMLQVLLLF